MNESMLMSFLQILAAITAFKKDDLKLIVRKHVEGFIIRNFGKRNVNEKLADFEDYLSSATMTADKKQLLSQVCKKINSEYPVKQKYFLLINIFSFYSFINSNKSESISSEDSTVSQIAEWLNINRNDFLNFQYFGQGQILDIPQKNNLLISSNENPDINNIRFLKCEGLSGYILFLHFPSVNILLFKYNGTSILELSSKPIYTNHIYIFSPELLISGKDINPIYYGDVIRRIFQVNETETISLTANSISYSYWKSTKGIKPLSLKGRGGELVGIMGGSGAGKSTLLKLLSGTLKPQHGEVLLNGKDINTLGNEFKGLLSVMHQEECLVEELTVYENLLFSTRLALGDLPISEIRKMVDNKLVELDLVDCKDNRVGTVGNRQLSGGQRKRLAIAMEIIREPKILLVDEPTSGLSSSDSEVVMSILKNIALQDKLVVVNIHQPSSDIYKLFDSIIIIDKGGFPIFWGNPNEAILHFKTISNRVNKNLSGCEFCGTLKPELIFEIVEERNVNELGQKTTERKYSPEDWNKLYSKKISEIGFIAEKRDLPKPRYQLPKLREQFQTFFKRNLLSKLRNIEFVVLSLALPPILAVLIAVFLKYSIPNDASSSPYTLFSNPNLSSFFLMCILASLFFGLILSCDDIFKDKQLIAREEFIGLNLGSYLNSKILFLVLLSAYQTFAFAWLGSQIIELKGMVVHLWLILFSVSILGNLLGLIISSTLKSIVAIYILVPFLLIPQILFSGLVVRFDNLNPRLTSEKVVPIAGEIMASRWASEALITHFYITNDFNKPFFEVDYIESLLKYKLLNLLPDIQHTINSIDNQEDTTLLMLRVINGIHLLLNEKGSIDSEELMSLPVNEFKQEATLILNELKEKLSRNYAHNKKSKDNLIESLYPNTPCGRQQFLEQKNKYHNKSIDDLVRNRFYPKPFILINEEYIQKADPIFQEPTSKYGRSHFLAPVKQIMGQFIITYWFNLTIIWVMIIFFYLVLHLNLLPKILLLRFVFLRKEIKEFV